MSSTTFVHLVGSSNFDQYYSKLQDAEIKLNSANKQLNDAEKELDEKSKTHGYKTVIEERITRINKEIVEANKTVDAAKKDEHGFAAILQTLLGDKATVVNHAIDGFTTRHILEGGVAGRSYPTSTSAEQVRLTKYLEFKGRSWKEREVKPLERLTKSINENEKAKHYVVIDAGTEDIQEYIKRPWTFFDIRNLPSRYNQIVQKVKSINEDIKPILVIHERITSSSVDCKQLKWVAVIAASVNALCIATIGTSLFLSLLGKMSRLKAGFYCLLAGSVFQALRTYVAPLKVTMGFYKKDIGMLMINSIWERLYRPVLREAMSDEYHVLDLASSIDPYKAPVVNQLFMEGIAYIVNIEQPLHGGSVVFKTNKEFKCEQNQDPAHWTPTFRQD